MENNPRGLKYSKLERWCCQPFEEDGGSTLRTKAAVIRLDLSEGEGKLPWPRSVGQHGGWGGVGEWGSNY